MDDVKEAYAKLRESHERRRAARKLVSIDQARKKRFAPEWARETPEKPSFTGLKVFRDYPLGEIAEYIDWSPFFHAWELKGVYPKIFEHERWGDKARELFDDARKLLRDLIENKRLRASGVFGFFPANSLGDDIELYTDEARGKVLTTLHCLRQQNVKENGRAFYSLADYVAPKETGRTDYIGAFAATAGEGVDELARQFEADHDPYNAIMVKALADRCAEAFAELLHKRAREAWGYGEGEALSNEALIKEKYRGIRPAPGYPASPDHTEKRLLFDLLEVEKNTGITLTENFAMHPAASVCGLYFAHPKSIYFDVGKIDRDQIADYSRRKGMPVEEVERWLAPNLNYEPQ